MEGVNLMHRSHIQRVFLFYELFVGANVDDVGHDTRMFGKVHVQRVAVVASRVDGDAPRQWEVVINVVGENGVVVFQNIVGRRIQHIGVDGVVAVVDDDVVAKLQFHKIVL